MASNKLKLLYLLDIFRQETDQAHRLTVPQLLEALGERGVIAERKSIYRDIRALMDYGADIRKTPSGYFLEGRSFLPGEARILAEALRAAPFLTQRRTENLIARLGMLLSRYQAETILSSGLGAPKAPDDEALRAMEALRAAIDARCQISFSCREGGGPARRFRASPYALILLEGRCCLACNLEAEGRGDLSLLPLSRVSSVRRDATPWRHFSQASPYAGRFDARDYAARCARFCAGPPLPLRLLCGEEALPDALDRLNPAGHPQRQADGRFLITAEAAESPELLRWLLSFGGGLEVLEPPALRAQIRRSIQASGALYEDPPE